MVVTQLSESANKADQNSRVADQVAWTLNPSRVWLLAPGYHMTRLRRWLRIVRAGIIQKLYQDLLKRSKEVVKEVETHSNSIVGG